MEPAAGGLPTIIHLAYLAAAICFIVGLKRLSSPATARSGNGVAAIGMGLAVVATLLIPGLRNHGLILGALLVSAVIAAYGARVVRMTDIPQVVALLNGLGGGAAALVSVAEFLHAGETGPALSRTASVTIALGTLIGSVSFSGSLIAFGKLQGLVSERPVTYPLQKTLNLLLFSGIALVAFLMLAGTGPWTLYALLAGSLLLGVMMVIPIGGADMPVVISLLNSFTGLAAAATGFVLTNNALIISGTLVGASGTILTQLMCKAMNRSLLNVLFGAFGAVSVTPAADRARGGTRPVRDISIEDAAVLLSNIHSLVIVPGYGMAVAQAQHAVRELADLLGRHGTTVKYAIHPVAGRMPGHMNVLLAEANVPYPQLYDLEQINPEFEQVDVALVIGANDVVNPAARHDKQSPIYGMPILDVDKARHVIIVKRSLNPGFAGIDNELYYQPKTMMLFADARAAMTQLVAELKHMGS
ncbi:MAG TPA: NAD(P)(+) transhydrogenase (Re/Si-specific) subunit beta [Candidatus Limnocylindria bacterium]|nr:NAD(P)(+) transhydrogenase (Re/Si-specific) subunit beta [Candidatus Limnocylindria bacterium]